MELLGNRNASLDIDEVFGTMAASGVIIDQMNVRTKEEAWRLWWEKAVREGHVRWALLPPTSPLPRNPLNHDSENVNCAMPSFSARHLASSGSGLDTVTPLGPVTVEHGVVEMPARWAGDCKLIRRLGRVHRDITGLLCRDITLILFGGNNWTRSLRVARAFGGGRYTSKKILILAQVLKHNFYRAQLAVLTRSEEAFRPAFRNQYYQYIWSDFMLLQSVHMMTINEGVAFLADVWNDNCMIDVAVVMGSTEQPTERLAALDFGAKDTSDRTVLIIVELPDGSIPLSFNEQDQSPSLHKVGVTVAVDITDVENARKHSALSLSDRNEYPISMGGGRCIRCKSTQTATVLKQVEYLASESLQIPLPSQGRAGVLRLRIKQQHRAIKPRRAGFWSRGRNSRRRRLRTGILGR